MRNNSNKTRGGQPGNSNAKGNKGGAPRKNQNAVKHGGYSKILWDSLTPEEQKFLSKVKNLETEDLLQEEIMLLTIRIARLMQRLTALQGGEELYIASTTTVEEKRDFDSPEDESRYNEWLQGQVDSGERLPGKTYTETTLYKNKIDLELRIHEALTRLQDEMRRHIESLEKMRREKGDTGKISLADAWITAVLESI